MAKEGDKKDCLQVCFYPSVEACVWVCLSVFVLAVSYLRLTDEDREPITVVALCSLHSQKKMTT